MTAGGGEQALELRRTLEKLWQEVASEVPATDEDALASAELALYAAEGPLRLAVDRLGHRHLLVPTVADRGTVPEWRSEGVQLRPVTKIVDDEPVGFLDLECRRDDLNGVYTGLVADVCVAVAKDARISGLRLIEMLESWRELLGGSHRDWTVPRLAGLYGELAILELLLRLDPAATEAWVGPTGAPQDFRRRAGALEVKSSTAAVGRLVRVHGVDQLETPVGGTLSLIWSRYAAVPHGEGDSIPSIVERCLAGANSALLLGLLDRMRLPSFNSPELRDVGFTFVERSVYDVGPDFPRITPDRFIGGAVPAGVQAVEYMVDLDTVPSTEDDLIRVLGRFLESE
ncbi:PD-(D/E)XK motif protein [Paractinoplanes brasiliensis]|uniref:Putative PD-(D/E)XK family protein DUF4420 n=1 Tax=Paractinoplanes brasiliensis TaxID=52695 RepID=A0A4R6JSP7_9ACTN|nr:PD-(D/E)XK motif protein [Actinoplanes brasiliensis]TDO39733.1 putative PD-(D/E)XK family protein DUF4420 [Actinoplanes brasiliensis]GID28930.1 hypothetical protein Abr02nite_39130 [Actinoplanes brasiliensis]